MAHSDDYLFLSDCQLRLRAFRFATDGGMPEPVREFKGLNQPRGMAFHKATGTLLVACIGGVTGVRLLDTRSPPAMWRFLEDDRASLQMAADSLAKMRAHGATDCAPDLHCAMSRMGLCTSRHTIRRCGQPTIKPLSQAVRLST
jgi:hypothetical protein